VTAPPVGVAPCQRAAAATVAAATPPHAAPATATWLCVPPCALAAIMAALTLGAPVGSMMEPAGAPGVNASPLAPPP